MPGQAFRKFLSLTKCWLKSVTETVAKGVIMRLEKAQGKALQPTVVEPVGSGTKEMMEIQLGSGKVGGKILLDYGSIKVVLDNKDYFAFRDGDYWKTSILKSLFENYIT
ncbi:10 kDa heat shock protein, mitochondrial-like [Ochotona curzoniae]|uniref:10 kDa heat shock protein, mitochondrial-like n=1 Tax=Ochotona curzoniae TaxID=130825 RepID=UPI001B34D3AF|nr:10 kDa heat shock protein, mitochondrial-like [Ochotona curzoniae]